MNSRLSTVCNKRGSCILEASLTLPVFIIAFIAIALVINIIAACEEMAFKQSRLVYEMDMKAPLIIPNPGKEGYKILRFRYLYSDSEIEDLICIDSEKDFRVENPIGILGEIKFRLNIKSRAFTGARLKSGKLPVEAFSEKGSSHKVIIFPKYGLRYHGKGCRYVRQEYPGEEVKLEMEMRDAEMKGLTPCLVCGGG